MARSELMMTASTSGSKYGAGTLLRVQSASHIQTT